MYFSRALLVGASLVAATLAQPPHIAFTKLPDAVVTAGQPVDLAWSGGDGTSPVTITLKQGESTNLATIAIITGNATGTTYTWTPSTSLPSANNYALQISQGVNDNNYSGLFAIVSGSTATATTTANSTASATTAIIIAGPSGTTTIAGNATAIITTLSAGTGTALPRNTTFSTQMLSTTTVVQTTGTGGVVAGTPTGSASGSGATGASASASTTGGASQMAGSSLALVLCAAVGMWVLN